MARVARQCSKVQITENLIDQSDTPSDERSCREDTSLRIRLLLSLARARVANTSLERPNQTRQQAPLCSRVMDVFYPHHTYNVKDSVSSLSQWPPPENAGSLWPENYTDFEHLTRHATVMGSTWGLLIPAAILMARLRNKKGWWFQLHRALAIASLFLVVVGTILGRRLRVSHPPVTTAGKLHKFFGYTAVTCICVQALSALLWRPHSGHSLKPTWNKVHINWGKATMAVGATAVCLGIYVSGVGWPWYLMFAFSTGSILGAAYYIDPLSSKKVPVKTSQHETVRTNGHVAQAGSNSPTEVAGGIIPWFSQRVQTGTKQA